MPPKNWQSCAEAFVADYEIIEADFQQYYNIDIATLKFCRYARLLVNLPMESRFFRQYVESKDWNWDKEVQSRILLMLDIISCQISNMGKKKGAKPRKPDEQFQPSYVKEAKKHAERKKKEANLEEMEDLRAIFSEKNRGVRQL